MSLFSKDFMYLTILVSEWNELNTGCSKYGEVRWNGEALRSLPSIKPLSKTFSIVVLVENTLNRSFTSSGLVVSSRDNPTVPS